MSEPQNRRQSLNERITLTKGIVGFLLGITVVPALGIYWFLNASGPQRTIGAGLIFYGAILLLLPFALYLTTCPPKWAPPGGIVRLLPVGACFMIPIPIIAYLKSTMTRFDPTVGWFIVIPTSLLGVALFASWIKDFMRRF